MPSRISMAAKSPSITRAPAENEAEQNAPSPNTNPNPRQRRQQQQPPSKTLFAIPTPVKQLFDRFPLLTYPSNPLPLRAPPISSRNTHVLYIFATEAASAGGGGRQAELSFNPACLKWQAYLTFCGIDFRIERSNNHASPSGALPFLLPRKEGGTGGWGRPVVAGKLQRWCREECERGDAKGEKGRVVEEPGDLRYEAYLSLVDLRIRRAWLYTIYLTNPPTPSEPLYILPPSTNPLVRLSTARSLRAAAEAELLKHSATIDADELYKGVEEAFAALEMLLGDHEWFFGANGPGLFDASVFSYMHLLLDENFAGVGWRDGRLRDAVKGRGSLVAHRNRVLGRYL
ncbi:hypothetical protein CC80DRAFT_598600 [Byssothecium circinans]|uniref:Mitochondrial outer membrane protein n=1 Tax=Byssothecium circinans TaxID=147558 RepID=A0A6A5TDN2_9PLEO|nr:hypothetical protein CC80DRAFT_598600 [Byssothecium circinans]